MNIICIRNRFSNLAWPRIEWVGRDFANSTDYMLCMFDFLVFVGPDLELLHHPDTLITFRANELIGVISTSEAIHTKRPDFPAPLGYFALRDDFFVLKAGRYAADFLAKWRENGGDVSLTVWELGVPPMSYPTGIVWEHCAEDSLPTIQWGFE